MEDCPLVPRGVRARVTSTAAGFAVAIGGEDDRAIEAIRVRAAKLEARVRK